LFFAGRGGLGRRSRHAAFAYQNRENDGDEAERGHVRDQVAALGRIAQHLRGRDRGMDDARPDGEPDDAQAHDDSVVRQAEDWLRQHFREPQAVAGVVAECAIAERSLKRRFTAATRSAVIGQLQNLRIEEAKRLLETGDASFDDIAAAVGYESPAFFRKVFKRCTGLTAGRCRCFFRRIYDAARIR